MKLNRSAPGHHYARISNHGSPNAYSVHVDRCADAWVLSISHGEQEAKVIADSLVEAKALVAEFLAVIDTSDSVEKALWRALKVVLEANRERQRAARV